MTDTSLRYLATLEVIPRYPESITVDQIMLALDRRGFSIDKRSVQRDLLKLSIPFKLICEQEGKQNLWSYDPDKPPSMFPAMDEHTALSFQLVEGSLKNMMPPETVDSMEPWFRMAGERLSSRRGDTAKWQEKIHILPPGLPRLAPRINPDVRDEVYQAILHEYPLNIHYRSRESKASKEHVISPLGLVVRDHVIYLVAAMNEGGSILQFVLHRVKDVQPAEVDYMRPVAFNLSSYVDEKFGFPLGTSPTFSLKLKLGKQSAISVSDCPLVANQTLVPNGDGAVLSAEVRNTLELRQWIRSLGIQAEVLEPGFLRAEFAAEAAELASRYGDSDLPVTP